jgi:hypothetical protein
MVTSEVVDFLDCDIEDRTIPYEGVLYGERANGNFALFSLVDKEYCFEVDCVKYGAVRGSAGLQYCLDGELIYLLYGEYVLVLDVAKRELVKEICYASSEVLQRLRSEKRIQRGVTADLICVRDGVVALTNCWIGGWGGVIDTRRSDELLWVNTWDDVTVMNMAGDLLYVTMPDRNVGAGIDYFPAVIDMYNGNIVWKAKQSTYANVIRVGNSWVVYSTISGNLQCYKMKNEVYHSPDHPQT